MTPQPLDATEIRTFLEQLDEAGDRLRELVEESPPPGGPAVQFYLDGAAYSSALSPISRLSRAAAPSSMIVMFQRCCCGPSTW